MESILDSILESGLEEIIQGRILRYLSRDTVFQSDMQDLKDLEERVDHLNLQKHDRYLIEDYCACLKTVQTRKHIISYIAAIYDTVMVLKQARLLKI